MKTGSLLLSLVVAGMMAGSCTTTPDVPEGEYLIEGRVPGVLDGTVIELMKEEGQFLTRVHTDTVRRGRFSFRDTLSGTAPRKLLLYANAEGFPGTWTDVWLPPISLKESPITC